MPEILRTPLQSLCLQIKSLRLGSISEFLSRALQSPEILAVMVNLIYSFFHLIKLFYSFIVLIMYALFASRIFVSLLYLQVQNAVEYLEIIGALDESENLTILGRLIPY